MKHLGSIGYATFSSGHVTDEMVHNFLENHKNGLNHDDVDFKI